MTALSFINDTCVISLPIVIIFVLFDVIFMLVLILDFHLGITFSLLLSQSFIVIEHPWMLQSAMVRVTQSDLLSVQIPKMQPRCDEGMEYCAVGTKHHHLCFLKL